MVFARSQARRSHLLPLNLSTEDPLFHGRLPEEKNILKSPSFLLVVLIQRFVFFVNIMFVLVVYVNEGSLDICKSFEFPLQRLTNIVGYFQW